MTEQLLSENSEHQHSNGDVSKFRDEHRKNRTRVKVYTARNSVLTDLMSIAHVQTVYNISVAVCMLLAFTAVGYYITLPHQFWDDVKLMKWATGRFPVVCVTWLVLNVICLSIHQGMRLWAQHRHRLPYQILDIIFILYFSLHVIAMFVLTPSVVMRYSVPPITAFAILAEQTRMFMKVYSLLMENYRRIRNYNYEKDGDQLNAVCPSVSHFIFFMFAPVLIYRDSYPRTQSIRWSFVIASLAKMLACIFITYCMFMRFNVSVFQNIGHEPFHLRHMVFIAAGSMFVGSMMMFMVFFAILHCWLNAFAELTRFGDRLFYKDWWNSTSFLEYYRKWNETVYDWLYKYVYVDVHKLGVSRSFARLNVFIVSAAAHDYIICFALGYFFPALGIVYATVGVILIFVTNQKTSSFWNTFMWLFLFSGWGFLIFLHSAEWYARQNCPVPETGSLGYYIRSISCLEIDNL